MKNKSAIYEEIHNLITTFLIFFALCGFVVSCSFMIFFKNIAFQEEQIEFAAAYCLFSFSVSGVAKIAKGRIVKDIKRDVPAAKVVPCSEIFSSPLSTCLFLRILVVILFWVIFATSLSLSLFICWIW